MILPLDCLHGGPDRGCARDGLARASIPRLRRRGSGRIASCQESGRGSRAWLRIRHSPPIEAFRAAPYLPILVGVDPLSAWFVLILSAVGAATSVAALGYARYY